MPRARTDDGRQRQKPDVPADQEHPAPPSPPNGLHRGVHTGYARVITAPLTCASSQESGARSGDISFQSQYVAEILVRHNLAGARRETVADVNVTNPALHSGDILVTPFGSSRSWCVSQEVKHPVRTWRAIDRSLGAGGSSVQHVGFTPDHGSAHARW